MQTAILINNSVAQCEYWVPNLCFSVIPCIECIILPFKILKLQYIPRNMHTVFALLCFVVVIHWLIFPYPPGLLHWHCGNLTFAPVPAKQPWWIWINTKCEFIMNDCITTTSKATLMNMDKYLMWIHYERLHNHNKAKHNKTVCIFLGIYCTQATTRRQAIILSDSSFCQVESDLAVWGCATNINIYVLCFVNRYHVIVSTIYDKKADPSDPYVILRCFLLVHVLQWPSFWELCCQMQKSVAGIFCTNSPV